MKAAVKYLFIISFLALAANTSLAHVPSCPTALAKIIPRSKTALELYEEKKTFLSSAEVTNFQAKIFQLRARGDLLAAQALEDKVAAVLAGPFSKTFPIGSGAGSGNYHIFEQGIVGVGKRSGKHWSTNAEAEVAAFKIDRLFDLNLVPVTVTNDQTPGVHLSMQLFYQGAREARTDVVATAKQADRDKLKILDYLIGNFDRRDTNYLVTSEGHIIAIDHGVSLHNIRSNPYSPRAPLLHEIDKKFFETNEGKRILRRLRTVSDDQIRFTLEPLSKPKAIEDFIQRKTELLNDL